MNKYSGKIGIVVTASLLSFVLASPAHAWDWFKGDKGEQGEVGQQGPQGQKGDDGFGTQADLDNVNARIDNVMSDMKYMDQNLSAGIASSISIGQHQFDPSFKGGQVSLSGGFYNGENAVSFAVGVPVGERAFFSASIAADSGSYGESGGVGLTFQLPK